MFWASDCVFSRSILRTGQRKLIFELIVAPFGKLEAPRKDLIEPELGRKYWEWCESQVAQFV